MSVAAKFCCYIPPPHPRLLIINFIFRTNLGGTRRRSVAPSRSVSTLTCHMSRVELGVKTRRFFPAASAIARLTRDSERLLSARSCGENPGLLYPRPPTQDVFFFLGGAGNVPVEGFSSYHAIVCVRWPVITHGSLLNQSRRSLTVMETTKLLQMPWGLSTVVLERYTVHVSRLATHENALRSMTGTGNITGCFAFDAF